ncbi:unnamed protein product, partial [Durusdinium trenchii]
LVAVGGLLGSRRSSGCSRATVEPGHMSSSWTSSGARQWLRGSRRCFGGGSAA